MATKINKTDKNLGFDGDAFELVIKKPNDGSVWCEIELKAGKNVQKLLWRKSEASEKLARRLKTTAEAFLDSSFDNLVLVGKVVKEKKQ